MSGQLSRALGPGGAVVIGLASMVGAGVFAVYAPAAQSAGTALLVGLVIAAAVATCNATSSAQLAAVYPQSGGTYLYGRERLGSWWGFVAGWSFVIGKTASCAAMAITFAAYAAPDGWQRPAAAAAVALVAAVNYRGVTGTRRLATVVVVIVLVVLAVVVLAAASTGLPRLEWTGPGSAAAGWYGVLQASGLLFFAFAGYARIATLGEEVKDPARTIPRAILLALTIAVLVYAAVAVAALGALGPHTLARSGAPLSDTVAASGWLWAGPLVQFGGAVACLGALLSLMAGVGRTTLAMARGQDLPGWLSAVHRRFHVPHRAELVIAAAVIVLVLTIDLRGAIGFSSFGVLLYYLITNLAAFTQDPRVRRFPRAVQLAGILGCGTLVLTLPPSSIVGGLLVLLVGVLGRVAARTISRGRRNSS